MSIVGNDVAMYYRSEFQLRHDSLDSLKLAQVLSTLRSSELESERINCKLTYPDNDRFQLHYYGSPNDFGIISPYFNRAKYYGGERKHPKSDRSYVYADANVTLKYLMCAFGFNSTNSRSFPT